MVGGEEHSSILEALKRLFQPFQHYLRKKGSFPPGNGIYSKKEKDTFYSYSVPVPHAPPLNSSSPGSIWKYMGVGKKYHKHDKKAKG